MFLLIDNSILLHIRIPIPLYLSSLSRTQTKLLFTQPKPRWEHNKQILTQSVLRSKIRAIRHQRKGIQVYPSGTHSNPSSITRLHFFFLLNISIRNPGRETKAPAPSHKLCGIQYICVSLEKEGSDKHQWPKAAACSAAPW